MMKKFYLIAAAAAAVLVAGCAKNEVIQTQGPGDAVSFGVYVPKTLTKAGEPGTITTDGTGGTTTSLQTVGFGVFATYSDGMTYEGWKNGTNVIPNFMYNTKVSGASWTYSPIKYWPNETIDDNNSAIAPAAADMLSFFAYAPHVSSASGPDGITVLPTNDSKDDPKVTFVVATDPSEAVDLIWAVAPAGGFSYKDVHNATVSVEAGMPLKNLTKPNTTETIPFHFRHATARLGFKIVGAFDQIAEGGELNSYTKVTVERVSVVNLPVHTQGDLNLNNTTANTPKWENLSGSSTTLVITDTDLNANIKDSGSGVQTVTGVTNYEQNVFADDNNYFTLIPENNSTTATISITYYVTTSDAALDGGCSRVKNVIYKNINFASGFQAGKAYTIKIILGLTSVKLVADVQDWDVVTPDTEVDLPKNKDANSFALTSTTVSVAQNATTGALWASAEGAVTMTSVKLASNDSGDYAEKFTFDAENKTIKAASDAVAQAYHVTLHAAGDSTHDAKDQVLTLTVTTPAP